MSTPMTFGDWTFDRERFTLTLADERGTLTFECVHHGHDPRDTLTWLHGLRSGGRVTPTQVGDLIEALGVLSRPFRVERGDACRVLERERYELARRLFHMHGHATGVPGDDDEGRHLKVECIREVDAWFATP